MQVISNESIIHVDIDDTLILHDPKFLNALGMPKTGHKKVFVNPYTEEEFTALVSEKHIQLLKNYKARGFFIIAHSGNGWRYTKSIIEQLEISDIIDLVHTKNNRYIDDIPCEKWMGNRIYLEDN